MAEIDIARNDDTFTLIVGTLDDVKRIVRLFSTRARRQSILAEAEGFFNRKQGAVQ